MKVACAPALVVALLSPIALAGCGAVVAPAVASARAAAHGGASAPAVAPSASCDRDAARQLLALDCSALSAAAGERRTDSIASSLDAVACATGIVRLCPMPACTAPTYP